MSKYSHRGFEVYWPHLDRTRVDPTIYERAFNRVQGLARLLVLEKLPHPQDRDEYLNKRRVEKGRPELPWNARFRNQLPGNVKDAQPDDVAEWITDDSISGYSSFTLPWGPRYSPKKIERLLFQQDLLKNAEFNKPKDREANLHRHPAFFGTVDDVIGDCCGFCPQPATDADYAAFEEESKVYVSGTISFMKDDPGRQQIGSFHPLTNDDWTEMAYIGSSVALCEAIVSNDLQAVKEWFNNTEGVADINRRDHTGRTPLQLAVMTSSPDIVQYLIDRGARMVARMYDGMTALHLAAWRGSAEMVKSILDRSAENEAEETTKDKARKQARKAAAGTDTAPETSKTPNPESDEGDDKDSDVDDLTEDASESDEDNMTESFVKIEPASEAGLEKDNEDDPDVFDVDVVAWDAPCSPLHLAIIAGRTDVISLLIDRYGADVMLPVKLMTNEIPRRPRGAILSLLLPLDLSTKFANQVEETLLKHGASPLQASMDQRTAIHQIVALAKVEYLKICVQVKPETISKAINRVIVESQYWSTSVDCPLLSAIKSGSVEMAREVLNLGAKAVIELEDFIRAYNTTKDRRYRELDEQSELYYTKVTQPVIQAARQENMIDLIIPLLNKGADVNTITEASWEFVQESNRRWNAESLSLLDIVRNRRQELEAFVKKSDDGERKMKRVDGLKNDEHYLQGFAEGSYQKWSATKDLETAKFIQSERNKHFAREFQTQPKNEISAAKKDAVALLSRKYKAVENRLVEEGAKTFYELYPKLRDTQNQSANSQPTNASDKEENAYETRFKFSGTSVTPSQTQRYIQLFEAAWTGKTDIVRRLCLEVGDDEQHPLEVAVIDHNGFNVFSLAVLRTHYELATNILQIAALQYRGSEADQRKEYSLRAFDSDDSDDVDGDDQPRFHERLINDKFTIDDIDVDAAKNIKSNTSAAHMMNDCHYQLWRFKTSNREESLRRCRVQQLFDPNPYIYSYNSTPLDSGWSKFHACVNNENYRTQIPLVTYAVVTNDTKMLKFILENELKHTNQEADELLKSVPDRKDDLHQALSLGYTDIVDLLLRSRGTLLPLEHLAEKSGVTIDEAPKYYQGLSVYGKKRKDWANPQRFTAVSNTESGSLLLNAIMQGNLDIVDYAMSNTPARRYEEFCNRFSQDQRVRALAESKGGLSSTLNTWMGTRADLALHVAVMSWPYGANQMIKNLLSKVPNDYLETRTAHGETPLQLALQVANFPAFELLLSSGAKQNTRDRKGHNLLHTIYSSAEAKKNGVFAKLISLLDQSLLQKLLMERTRGELQTPLALYLSSNRNREDDFRLLDEMLALSGGKDLSIMDGSGDYPLHIDVRSSDYGRAVYLAKKRPDLLFLENATGRTPIDVATTAYLQSRMKVPQNTPRHASVLEDPHEAQVSKTDGKSVEVEDDLPRGDNLYSSLVRIARDNPQPRHLVALLDANETARRLAGKESRNNQEFRRRQAQGLKAHRWHRYYSRNQNNDDQEEETDDGSARQDEVVQWVSEARNRYLRVPFCEHESSDLEAELQRWRDFAEGKIQSIQCCELADSDDPNERRAHRKITSEINVPI